MAVFKYGVFKPTVFYVQAQGAPINVELIRREREKERKKEHKLSILRDDEDVLMIVAVIMESKRWVL